MRFIESNETALLLFRAIRVGVYGFGRVGFMAAGRASRWTGGRVDGWTGGRPVEPSGSTAQFIAARLNLSQVDQ